MVSVKPSVREIEEPSSEQMMVTSSFPYSLALTTTAVTIMLSALETTVMPVSAKHNRTLGKTVTTLARI